MRIIHLYVIIQEPGFEPIITLGAAYIPRPQQETRADMHVMSTATKRVNASELRLNPLHVNKIATPHGTLKRPLHMAKHLPTAVCMLRANPETHHATIQPGK
jgi:hypothetical protein